MGRMLPRLGSVCFPASCSFRAPGNWEGVCGPSCIPGEQARSLQHKLPWWLVQVRLWMEKLPKGSLGSPG